jgi:steroid delta-isomerase-like uncharacterized protein
LILRGEIGKFLGSSDSTTTTKKEIFMKLAPSCVCVCFVILLLHSQASAQEGTGSGRGGRGSFRAQMEKNRALITNMFAWYNSASYDSLKTIIAKDVVDHNPDNGEKPGLDGMIDMYRQYVAAFPDVKMTVNDMVIEGDKVTVRATVEGTNTGKMMGAPPTGKKMSVTMMEEFVIKDSMVTDRYGVFDAAAMMAQLGMLPTPSDSTKK